MSSRSRYALLLLSLALGCAPRRPVLYPNQHLGQVGPAVAEADINDCRQLAASYVSSNPGARVAGHTAVGGATGAAVGAVGGAVSGGAGTGAAVGAAAGATAGLLHGLFTSRQPSATEQRFVEKCLAERGYHVIGWE
jgi:outer membrane lipoprotein SlyB